MRYIQVDALLLAQFSFAFDHHTFSRRYFSLGLFPAFILF